MYATIKGQWYDGEGYQAQYADRLLVVEVIGGRLYDPELRQMPGGGKITIDGNALTLWAAAEFVAEEGELARIGLMSDVEH